jgi:hypothetical protein
LSMYSLPRNIRGIVELFLSMIFEVRI